MNVGFIGAGKMAQSLAKGFITAGVCRSQQIIASCPPSDQHLLEEMKRLGCETTNDNDKVVSKSEVILLAVKPQVIPKVLQQASPKITSQHLVMSIALGVTIKQLQENLPSDSRVIRVMPNTPCMIQQGASVFCCGSSVLPQDEKTAMTLLRSVGYCEHVPEHLLNAVTGLSGSGPAYMYLVIEALADGAVKMGLPRNLALQLAVHTMVGSAKMIQETNRHPGELKDDVCSPAGCTIAALSELEKKGLRACLISAVETAANKAVEISSS